MVHLEHIPRQKYLTDSMRSAGIADTNDAFNDAGTLGTPQRRHVRYPAEIRNVCDHDSQWPGCL